MIVPLRRKTASGLATVLPPSTAGTEKNAQSGGVDEARKEVI
jgi:hypothetical protein